MAEKTPVLGLNKPEGHEEASDVSLLNYNWDLLENLVGISEVTTLPSSPSTGKLVRHKKKLKLWDGESWVEFEDGWGKVDGQPFGDTGWVTLIRWWNGNTTSNQFAKGPGFSTPTSFLEVKARRIGPLVEFNCKFNQSSGTNGSGLGPVHQVILVGPNTGELVTPITLGTLNYEIFKPDYVDGQPLTLSFPGSYAGATIDSTVRSRANIMDFIHPFFGTIEVDSSGVTTLKVPVIQSPRETSGDGNVARFSVPSQVTGRGTAHLYDDKHYYQFGGVYFGKPL